MTQGRIAAGCLGIFLTVAGMMLPVAAAIAAASEAAVRIDVSGRQRMLSQRMAKASCFVMIDVAAAAHQAEALNAADEFEAGLDALQKGNDAFGLRPEKDTQTLDLLNKVSDQWASYGAAVRQLAYGETYSFVVTQILLENIPVLEMSNAAVGRITSINPVPAARPAMAKTINFAGRQRMLTQKMAKEFCFIAADVSADHMRLALKSSVDLFNKTLRQLTRGDYNAGIIDPPNLATNRTLDEVEAEWLAFRGLMEKALNEEPVTGQDLRVAAELANSLLALTHKTVGHYVSY